MSHAKTTTNPATACTCGSTNFIVTEHSYLPAELAQGRLLINTNYGEDGGFHDIECAICFRALDTSGIEFSY